MPQKGNTMGKTLRRTPDSKGIKVRSGIAIAAHMRNSAGAMGGKPRLNNRRDRQSVKRNLEFSIDEPSVKVFVKVIASGSGEVIRQIPNEEVLKLANSLNDASSLLFSAQA